ncbi:hypothetical protein Lal_00039268 [Lupinus albus]|nr:hypothetical protein Lal_00039268 [Lupinus albus]
MAHRAALNLACQNHSRVSEKPSCLLEATGHDLIGLPLKGKFKAICKNKLTLQMFEWKSGLRAMSSTE